MSQALQHPRTDAPAEITPCAYCGDPATEREHVTPRARRRATEQIDPMQTTRIVPACSECNRIASSKNFRSFAAKRAYIRDEIKRRNASLLEAPEWTEEELAELGNELRTHIVARREQRAAVEARIAYAGERLPAARKASTEEIRSAALAAIAARPLPKTLTPIAPKPHRERDREHAVSSQTVLRTLRSIRIDKGMALTQLAALTGINKGTLSQIERGRIVANNDELYSLGVALGARLDNRTVPCALIEAAA